MAFPENSLDDLIQGAANLLSQNKQVMPSAQEAPEAPDSEDTEFQSPVKGNYGNSGQYAPGVYLNVKHSGGHNGVDLLAPGGSQVYPVLNGGVVSSVASNAKGGNTISITYPGGYSTYYAHLGTISAHKGDKVDKNTPVATVGDSGNAAGTAPHVHIEIRQNGQLKNPASFIDIGTYKPKVNAKDFWISEDAKRQARSFNIQQHINTGKQQSALASKVNNIEKLASIYLDLATKL